MQEGHGLPLSQAIMVQWFQIYRINGRKPSNIGGTDFPLKNEYLGDGNSNIFLFSPRSLGKMNPFLLIFSLQLTRIWIGKISHPIVSMGLV